jgi:hypothetical protein
MATRTPARNYWQIPFIEGNYWTDPGGAGTAYNTFEMVVSGKGDGTSENCRCAMKFDDSSAPAWVSDGDATEVNCILFVYLGSDSSETPDGMMVAQVTAGAWDETSNFATMDGLTLGVFGSAITPLPAGNIDGWVAFAIPTTSAFMRNTLGLVFKVDVPGSGLDC